MMNKRILLPSLTPRTRYFGFRPRVYVVLAQRVMVSRDAAGRNGCGPQRLPLESGERRRLEFWHSARRGSAQTAERVVDRPSNETETFAVELAILERPGKRDKTRRSLCHPGRRRTGGKRQFGRLGVRGVQI